MADLQQKHAVLEVAKSNLEKKLLEEQDDNERLQTQVSRGLQDMLVAY